MTVLEQKLGYRFTNEALLKKALTHRSYGKANNERLEFLGDSILDMVIAEILYQKFSNSDEGKLTSLRSRLVRGETLATLAKSLMVDQHLILGAGELKSGGAHRRSILADTLEAIFAAIYLDADFDTVKTIIHKIYQPMLDSLSVSDETKDAKSRLQEYLQHHGLALPVYELINTQGKDHNAVFTVRCSLPQQQLSLEKRNTSIKTAEQACAQALLDKLLQ